MRAAVSLIEDSRADPDQFWRLLDLAWIGFVLLFGLGLFAYSAQSLSTAWHTASPALWDEFWHTPSDSAQLAVMIFALLGGFQSIDTTRYRNERLVAVRMAALAGDDTCAPVTRWQPAERGATTLTSGRLRISPLARPRSNRDSAMLAGAIGLLIIAGISGILTVVSLSPLFRGDGPDMTVAESIRMPVAIMLICAVVGFVLIHRYRRAGRPFAITVDDQGLRWRKPAGRHPGRPQFLEWCQAQAFVTFSWRSESTYAHHQAYALMAPGLACCWAVAQPTDEARAAHDQLAGLITASTGLPLRDLTEALDAALVVPSISTSKPALRLPFGRGTYRSRDVDPALPPPAVAPTRVESRYGAWRRPVRLGSLVALVAVPFLLLYSAGFALQRVQPRYFDSFLTRSEAQPPLYLDTLAQPDGEWLVQQPTPSDPSSYTYVHVTPAQSAYQLIGPDSDNELFAWEPHTFSDALVEVTARQVGGIPSAGEGGVGLILRERNDGKQFVEFEIDPSGEWQLWEYSSARHAWDGWLDIDSGQSAAIHRGIDASNRIAVLMRGDTFVLYVNGVFIGVRTDSSAPASGAAGVYVDSAGTGGQFSDFAVYPAYNGLPLIT